MGLAFVNFVSEFAGWAAYHNQAWVGKRFKDAVSPPSTPTVRPAGGPNTPAVTTTSLLRHLQEEFKSLFHAVREPSKWFCLAGVMYLLAVRRRPDDGE
jgi:hypothetical protein